MRGVCLDIDDTLSTDGKLTAEAYASLWRLKMAGLAVVPVTGRPAGWCDHIARFWPVDAVVGENGAFTFYMESGMRRRLSTRGAEPDPAKRKAQLDRLAEAIRLVFPVARWASDQSYREYDLAIDVREDVPPWSEQDVIRLLEICEREGAHAKLSSIHVNAWFGSYDKRAGFERCREAGPHAVAAVAPEEWLYVGDSPNDEPMFEAFSHSVGVANLAPYLPGLKRKPRWITQGHSGDGFAELVSRVVKAREN